MCCIREAGRKREKPTEKKRKKERNIFEKRERQQREEVEVLEKRAGIKR